MKVTRITDGPVTIRLDDGMDRLARALLSASETETVHVLEAAGAEVARTAEAQWYEEVTRRTGKSGQMDVVTTFDTGRDRVVVSVGSSDTRTNRGGFRGPLAQYVHRPGPLSMRDRYVTRGEWWAAKKRGLPVRVWGPPGNRTYVVEEHNPDAGDGGYLLPRLVVRPMQVRVRALLPEIGRRIAGATRG